MSVTDPLYQSYVMIMIALPVFVKHIASTIHTASTTMPPKRKCLAELDPNAKHPLLPEVYTPLERLEYRSLKIKPDLETLVESTTSQTSPFFGTRWRGAFRVQWTTH